MWEEITDVNGPKNKKKEYETAFNLEVCIKNSHKNYKTKQLVKIVNISGWRKINYQLNKIYHRNAKKYIKIL